MKNKNQDLINVEDYLKEVFDSSRETNRILTDEIKRQTDLVHELAVEVKKRKRRMNFILSIMILVSVVTFGVSFYRIFNLIFIK